MIKYRIKVKEEKKEEKDKFVDVWLEEECDNNIVLRVNDWAVFGLNSDGTGHLPQSIDSENNEGLQVDADGCILLTN